MPALYRYHFPLPIPLEEVEASLVLALFALESLRGESRVRLDARHALDPERRICVLDADSPVGRELNQVFVGFLRREFGPDAFQVERVADTHRTESFAAPAPAEERA